MEQAVVNYLKYLGIPISENYSKKIILSHPDYPSLLSVSDALEQLGIPSKVGKVEEEHLSKIEFPFMIHLESSREGLVLIMNEDDLSKDRIDLTQWKGIVLKAESVEKVRDSEHDEVYKKEQLIKKISMVLMVSLFAVLIIPVLETFSWINTALLSTSVFGVAVGYILFAKELGVTYKPVESFCNTSTRVNCDKILTSDGANILSFFSLSEAVFSYFAFQLIVTGFVLGFSNSMESYLWVLAVGSGLTVPIVFYSIYYQAVKAKTWCRLCMVVNAILMIQVIFFGFLFVQEMITFQNVEVLPFVISLLVFLAISSAVILLKEKSDTASELVNAEIAGKRVKHDPEVFTHLLFQGTKVDYSTEGEEMIIGNSNAPLSLLMVANINCYPCKLGFENVIELIDQYPEQVNVAIKFMMSRNTVHEIPASSFLIRYWKEHISGTTDESANTRALIQDWYVTMNTKVFEDLYPELENNDEMEDQDIAKVHYEWIAKHKIHRTPTFFINGFELPTNYQINDIGSLIAGLMPVLKEKNMTIHKTKELAE